VFGCMMWMAPLTPGGPAQSSNSLSSSLPASALTLLLCKFMFVPAVNMMMMKSLTSQRKGLAVSSADRLALLHQPPSSCSDQLVRCSDQLISHVHLAAAKRHGCSSGSSSRQHTPAAAIPMASCCRQQTALASGSGLFQAALLWKQCH
jgi:hypothetical protein